MVLCHCHEAGFDTFVLGSCKLVAVHDRNMPANDTYFISVKLRVLLMYLVHANGIGNGFHDSSLVLPNIVLSFLVA